MKGAPRKKDTGARQSQPRSRLLTWWLHHLAALRQGLTPLRTAPLASLMTLCVIGIALALPAGLYTVLDAVRGLGNPIEGSAQISVFLKHDIDHPRAQDLVRHLGTRPEIAGLQQISRAQALEEFRKLSGFADALDALPDNPLPAVLVITPAPGHTSPEQIERLLKELRGAPETRQVQLDMAWLQRLNALLALGQRGIMVIGAMLALAVLLIVGNTIRLDVQNRRSEIEIIKLVGASDGFVRRPFLYGGLWYGLLGGLIAVLLILLAASLLDAPLEELSALYGGTLRAPGLSPAAATVLLGGSALLGLTGAWLTVARHLRAIEPR